MKLYSAPGTCGTAIHIVLNWIGKPFEVEHLDFRGMKSREYLKLNPAGVVPTLVDGDRPLSEGLAILLKLVDNNPDADIGPAVGEPGRNQLYRWLAFLSATLHPFYWPYFTPQRYHADADQHGAVKAAAEARVASAFTRCAPGQGRLRRRSTPHGPEPFRSANPTKKCAKAREFRPD